MHPVICRLRLSSRGVALASPLIIALLVPGYFRIRGARIAFVAVPPLVSATYFGCQGLLERIYDRTSGAFLLSLIALADYRPEVRMVGALLRIGTWSSEKALSSLAFVEMIAPATNRCTGLAEI